jgi:hypothetical protein
MYIYNVTIKVLPSIEADWLVWMQTIHLDEVIETGKFDSYTFCELIDPTDDEGKTFVAQYFTDSKARYLAYIDEHAAELRQKGYDRFGNQFIAFRTVLEILKDSKSYAVRGS